MAERKINGREFQVGQVLATDAVLLQARLMKVIGAGVERLPVILKGAGDASEADKEASRAAAVAAFTDIFANSEPREMVSLISDVVGFATVKRKSGVFEKVDMDLDFTSDQGSLYPVAVFVLQEVLSDFFTGLRASGSQVKIPTA
jgi:hypothetical protein